MNLLEIIILGIVEGLTEYLPVSSTGHLLLTESLLNMSQSKEALDALAVCIQGGAILAVLSLYYPRVKTMVEGVRGTNPAGFKLLVNLILAFLPAAVVGLCLPDQGIPVQHVHGGVLVDCRRRRDSGLLRLARQTGKEQ